MELPGDSIGISDLLAFRDCPRRMSYGMRRHTGLGMQSDDRTPEAQSYATHYGSAIHLAIEESENGSQPEDAIQVAWNEYGSLLEPGDVQLLRDDLEVYESRDVPNVKAIAVEDDFRVPLMTYKGRQIYFRFRLDRLYERLDAPGTFIHVDYKSSKWAKSDSEVKNDLQMWAYNWGIHEYWPECENLLQLYDQLRYGQVPTRKSRKARGEMHDWLVKQATTVLDESDVRDDGLLKPQKNQWCAWCPVMESCPIISELSDFALAEIGALAPRRPKLLKDGTPGKRMEDVPLDPDKIDVYVEQLGPAKDAMRILDRYTTSVNDLLKRLSDEQRTTLGFDLREKNLSTFPDAAVRSLHEALGDRFYDVVKLTKTGLESELADDPELLEWALGLATKQKGAPSVIAASDDTA